MKISESTYEFLTEIKDNNNKIWFDTNKKRYISARNEFIDFLTAFMLRVNKFETLPVQDPAKCLYRIYRDVRFSPNKEPYKSHMAAIVSRGGQPKKCMFYIHLQAGETFVGGGMYDPAPEVLKAIRQEIHYNGHTLESLISSSMAGAPRASAAASAAPGTAAGASRTSARRMLSCTANQLVGHCATGT